MLKMILVCHLVALALITCLLVQCPAREFVGITLGYDQQCVVTYFRIIMYFKLKETKNWSALPLGALQ